MSRRTGRLFALLLRAYPAGFRAEYATDLEELFLDRLAEARVRGRPAVALLWLRTVPHMLLHGLLERRAEAARTGRADGGASAHLTTAARRLVRAPGLTATVVLTLGLGIGANVALFSLVEGVLLKPLPYPDADRLVRLWELNPEVDGGRRGVAPWNAVDWEREAAAFDAMATWYLTSGTYRGDDWVEEIRSAQVTPDFFRVLGVEPMIGRDFRVEEVERYGPIMLSHRMWMRRFGGDPSIVGQTVQTSGQHYLVVGVMPPDFAFPDESVEAWLAWNLAAVYADRPEYRSARFLEGIARLRPGETVVTAGEELAAVAAGLAERYPEHDRGWSAGLTTLHEEIVGPVRGSLWVAFASVLFILAMACLNVANLLMARVPARLVDVRLRVALGATRGRIVNELIAESALLGAAGGGLGLLAGAGLLDALVAIDAGGIPRLSDVGFDGPVVTFSIGIALLTTFAFGLAPAVELLRGSGARAGGMGRRSSPGRRHRTLRQAMVAAQLGLALVLLTGAGLLTASFREVAGVDTGIDPSGLATFRVSLDPVDGTAEEIVRYYEGLFDAVSGVSGVLAVSASQAMPLNPVTNDFRRPFRAAGGTVTSADAPTAQMRMVAPGYVATMGMSLVEGAGLPPEAGLGQPLVAMVNETLAAQLGDESVVGRTFEIDFRDGWQPYRIVGVVRDVRHYGPREAPQPEIFLSHAQVPYLAMTVVTRVRGEPEGYFDELEAAVLGYASQPPHHFVSMEALLGDAIAEERFLSILLTAFAAVALLLAATGVSGVIAFAVEHRRRELGVRMALGAEPRTVVRDVLWDTGRVASLGIAAGVVGALLLGRAIEGLLFGVAGTDPRTLSLSIGLLATVALLAGWTQARRAAWVDPTESLRAE